MTRKHLTIALAGNPNSGKTTIFNNLTGTRQKVGNWPGVTVEKKEGRINRFGCDLTIVDLPGTYSLTPFSIEEVVARNFLLDETPDVVIDIIDASNLERSLYLATQIRELDCKVLFALNMADLAQARGMKIDVRKMSELLDVPVMFTVGNRNEGMDDLLRAAIDLAESTAPLPRSRRVKYSQDIEAAVARLRDFMLSRSAGSLPYPPRWTAIKLIEDDQIVKERLAAAAPAVGSAILEAAQAERRRLAERYDDDPQIVMTDERYGFIAGIVREVQSSGTRQRVDLSRTIDLVLTHRFFGFPIFVFFIWAMFQLTFTVGEYPVEWIEAGVKLLTEAVGGLLPQGELRGLILDGVIAGVGSVIVFLPNILILFLCIAVFEDTGYMARSAFLMDRIMHLIGLHGKSFSPMLMGFGCNRHGDLRPVPAGDRLVDPHRAAFPLHPAQGRGCPLRHGAAPLPHAHGQEPPDPHVGPQQDLFAQDGPGHPARVGDHLGAVRVPPRRVAQAGLRGGDPAGGRRRRSPSGRGR